MKKKPKRDEPKKLIKDKKQKTEDTEPEKPFDFGGIPDRNLKKNLGCG